MPRQLCRKAGKAVGLPESQDVALLARILAGLPSQVETSIDRSFQAAGVTMLNLIALYNEDHQDAFEYLHIDHFSFPVRYDVLYKTSAAYAGYDYGLCSDCSDYFDKATCKNEQDNMPSEVVMTVLYTRNVLAV